MGLSESSGLWFLCGQANSISLTKRGHESLGRGLLAVKTNGSLLCFSLEQLLIFMAYGLKSLFIKHQLLLFTVSMDVELIRKWGLGWVPEKRGMWEHNNAKEKEHRLLSVKSFH